MRVGTKENNFPISIMRSFCAMVVWLRARIKCGAFNKIAFSWFDVTALEIINDANADNDIPCAPPRHRIHPDLTFRHIHKAVAHSPKRLDAHHSNIINSNRSNAPTQTDIMNNIALRCVYICMCGVFTSSTSFPYSTPFNACAWGTLIDTYNTLRCAKKHVMSQHRPMFSDRPTMPPAKKQENGIVSDKCQHRRCQTKRFEIQVTLLYFGSISRIPAYFRRRNSLD